jgi:hypothetical protein
VASERSGRFVIYRLADPEVCEVLCGAERVLEQAGESIADCLSYRVR